MVLEGAQVTARKSSPSLLASTSSCLSLSLVQDYEVLYMVDPLDEICSQSIVDYEATDAANLFTSDRFRQDNGYPPN